ncbi:MAG: restriction endonuclease subunit S [Lachnospiraceae bacterium]|jgi:type I restriction enzyme S subunit|nr:restriction endonuclease subunit S [Lachnospiraceae bacterium]MCI9096359.1 restriction endonuclease subunit S [Lachnospiraceae bacterium]
MSKIQLTKTCNITTGKLDANAAEETGKYPYFTCAPEPLSINTYAFDDDVILLAGNNASGNFHCQRYKGKFNAYQRTYVITAKQGYDIEYIYYNLKINLQHLKKLAQGSQTKFLTMQILDGFQIEDIHIPEQKRITEILKYIDRRIENNNKINQELKSMTKTIYDYWFLQFEFPNEDGKPYKSSGGKMVWNEELKKEIPVGWKVGNLYEIAEFINGLACQKYRPVNHDKKIPVIKIKEMHEGISESTEYVKEDIPEKNIINDGDILFSWSATLETMIWSGGKGGLNQHIFKIIPRGYAKYYVYMQLSAYIVNFIHMAEARKTTMGHITTDHLQQSRIAIPPKKIVDMYDERTQDFFDKIICNNKQNRELVFLRDFLLPLLMNGQVRFKE